MIFRLTRDIYINEDQISLIIRGDNNIKVFLKDPLVEDEEIDPDTGHVVYKSLSFIELQGRKAEIFMERLNPVGVNEDEIYDELEKDLEKEEEFIEPTLGDVKIYEDQ